jgi:hypothetical protein
MSMGFLLPNGLVASLGGHYTSIGNSGTFHDGEGLNLQRTGKRLTDRSAGPISRTISADSSTTTFWSDQKTESAPLNGFGKSPRSTAYRRGLSRGSGRGGASRLLLAQRLLALNAAGLDPREHLRSNLVRKTSKQLKFDCAKQSALQRRRLAYPSQLFIESFEMGSSAFSPSFTRRLHAAHRGIGRLEQWKPSP